MSIAVMASKKIHLFRQLAVEAGSPGDYYINPSEKLMSRTSEWSAVEHEDCIEITFNKDGFKDTNVYLRGYINKTIFDCENKMDEFNLIVNTDLLDHKGVKMEVKDGVQKWYIPKFRGDENKKKN
ncbi:hypothetical protein MKW94_004062 [Papaver nudicaule]|uniref:Uncharacterized protein n=1 Tax=Papaver nudicaule TaxID=74823 RepID=A0AA42AT47_PAPNU|nr:hypothetical protein [Papaver nudicaule]